MLTGIGGLGRPGLGGFRLGLGGFRLSGPLGFSLLTGTGGLGGFRLSLGVVLGLHVSGHRVGHLGLLDGRFVNLRCRLLSGRHLVAVDRTQPRLGLGLGGFRLSGPLGFGGLGRRGFGGFRFGSRDVVLGLHVNGHRVGHLGLLDGRFVNLRCRLLSGRHLVAVDRTQPRLGLGLGGFRLRGPLGFGLLTGTGGFGGLGRLAIR